MTDIGNIIIDFEHDIQREEWLYSKEDSTPDKLQFYGYDANLCPLPRYFSYLGWNENADFKRYEAARKRLWDYAGEVWFDDVQLKEKGEWQE